jgi:chemotaxis protein methyltransferase CheR
MVAPVAIAPMDYASAVEDLEIDLLLEGVFQRFGYDFRGYQREPLKEKLYSLMQSAGFKTVSALQESVLHDRAAGDALLLALNGRPAGLFDEPEHFLALRHSIGPWLRSCPSPKIWVADCLSAEEACTLSILLAEEQVYDKTQIFATVANESLLEDAISGSFAIERMPEYEANYRRSGGKTSLADYCVESNGRAVFLPEFRSNITWAQYNLTTDSSFNEFELIVCRRTLGDFGSLLRRRTLQLFHESLSLFGMLSVDEARDLQVAPFNARYKPVCAEQGLYRRIV